MAHPQPKTQAYANKLYAHFASKSVTKVVDGKPLAIWEGSLTKTCAELGIPRGTERRVVKPLEAMGCVEIVQRGVGRYPSVLVLNYPPTEDRWSEVSDQPLTGKRSYDTLARDVEEIKRQLGGANLSEVLRDHHDRLTALEQQDRKGT